MPYHQKKILSLNQLKTKLILLYIFGFNPIATKQQIMPHHKQFDIIPASQEEAELIDDKITDSINQRMPFTQKQNPILLKNYVIKDNGIIIAGIKADMYYWGMVYIEVLFVDENYRGLGLGTALLARLETDAKAAGATLIHLDSFDFQAYEFYLTHGYEIFGTLDNCPKGHKRYYLKKNL